MSILSAVLEEAEKVNSEDVKLICNEVYPKLKEVTEKIQMLSWALQQNLIDTHVHFSHTKTLEQLNYKNRKANILTEHEKLLERILQVQNKVTDQEFNDHVTKLNTGFQKLHELCIAAEGKRKLWIAEHEFRRYKYADAILEVESLRKELGFLKFNGDLGVALKNLSSGADSQLSLYLAQLSVEWEDLFSWSEQKSLYHQVYSLSVQQSDPMLMKNILRALHIAQRLNDELTVFSNFFINKLLHNLTRHNCEIFTDENLGAIIFNIKMDLTDASKPSFQTIFNNLTAVFEFLQSTLDAQFDGDKKFVSILAESIRDEFFNKIINDCIKTVLPTCETSYESYKNLVMELDLFNKFLIDLQFVEAEKSPLNEYMNTEHILHKKKYDKLLTDIRMIMKESLSYGTVCVGMADLDNDSSLTSQDKDTWDIINKPLFLPKCVVSQNVKKIVSLLLEHLEDSVKLPQIFSNQLVLYIRDIALMYQWLVPKQFKVNLESCPFDIALFFNNCFYMSHSLMGPSWKNVLPFQLADNLNTVLLECMHDLRVLGLEKMSLYLQKQKEIIAHGILPKDQSTWTHDTYRQFNSAVAEALALMRDLKCSWLNVLPLRMYEMSMCTLIQALCQCMINRLLADTQFIPEDIILQIRRTFDNALKDFAMLFEEPIDMENKINNWTKFLKMSTLLKGQLMEISELWNRNKDLSTVYSCEEVRKVVKMRFPDNNIRLKILADIQ